MQIPFLAPTSGAPTTGTPGQAETQKESDFADFFAAASPSPEEQNTSQGKTPGDGDDTVLVVQPETADAETDAQVETEKDGRVAVAADTEDDAWTVKTFATDNAFPDFIPAQDEAVLPVKTDAERPLTSQPAAAAMSVDALATPPIAAAPQRVPQDGPPPEAARSVSEGLPKNGLGQSGPQPAKVVAQPTPAQTTTLPEAATTRWQDPSETAPRKTDVTAPTSNVTPNAPQTAPTGGLSGRLAGESAISVPPPVPQPGSAQVPATAPLGLTFEPTRDALVPPTAPATTTVAPLVGQTVASPEPGKRRVVAHDTASVTADPKTPRADTHTTVQTTTVSAQASTSQMSIMAGLQANAQTQTTVQTARPTFGLEAIKEERRADAKGETFAASTPFSTETRGASVTHVTATHAGARADAASVARQIADAIPQSGDGAFEVRLSPEELGTVRLRMVPSEAGLVVQVQADRPETLDLLRRNIDMLADELARAGTHASGFSFGDNQQQQSGNSQQPGGPMPEQQDTPAVMQADLTSQTAPRSASGGIDIRL